MMGWPKGGPKFRVSTTWLFADLAHEPARAPIVAFRL